MTLTQHTFSGHNYYGYVSIAEADKILIIDLQRGSTWGPLSDDEKRQRIVAGTNRLDLLRWRGKRTDTDRSSQTNEFPREGLTYEDGTDVDKDAIPKRIERATALLAGTIARTVATADAARHGANIRRVRAGSAEVEFQTQSFLRQPIQDATVYELVRIWLVSGSAAGAFSNTAYGTDGTAFGDPYERSGGFG